MTSVSHPFPSGIMGVGRAESLKEPEVREDESKTVSSDQDRNSAPVTACTRSSQEQDNAHPSMAWGRAHKPSPLHKELWTVDNFRGRGS